MIMFRLAHRSAGGVPGGGVAFQRVTRRSWLRPAMAPVARGRTRVSAYFPTEERRESRRSWCCWCTADGEEDGEVEVEVEVEVEAERERVHCEVEVVSWRERMVRAWVLVDADADTVWGVLTDYEQLADFIPNLVCSGTIPCPYPGRVWLEQTGLQRSLYWHIEARVVLDLQEFHCSANERELRFSMVDGDFKKFEGKWSVKAGLRSCTSILYYEVNTIPRYNFPAIFLERIIRSDLPVNLLAIADRAERHSKEKILKLVSDASSPLISGPPNISNISQLSKPSSKNEKFISSKLKDDCFANFCIGVNSNWGLGKVCDLDRPCMVDEVHLRRYDGLLENGGVHRCVVASITVKSPVREVWNALTAYDALPEFVPNLAISKVISRENNKVRILQEGCKGLLYMVLHARVILDLWEQFEQEIKFEQVEGDFDSFQGKWLLEQMGNQHTLLKYVVESKMQKNSFLSEAIFEEVIYEDLPSNLCAIRDFVERKGVAESNSSLKDPIAHTVISDEEAINESEASFECDPLNNQKLPKQRARVRGLQRDIEVLKEELTKFISENGQEGFMPMRKQLRMHGRVDIEKAINRMGGFRKIASLMNLSLAYKHRKPKGYWDDLDNLQEEITGFQRNWGIDPTYMPSRKTFERAGRYDIARALEKWGGINEVCRLLALKARYPSRQAPLGRKEKKNDAVTKDEQEKTATSGKDSVVYDGSQKWLMQLKHLEMNWVD